MVVVHDFRNCLTFAKKDNNDLSYKFFKGECLLELGKGRCERR